MTAWTVGEIIRKRDGLTKRISTGAITNVFKRWQRDGYAAFRTNPYAFIHYDNGWFGRTHQEYLDSQKKPC